MYRGKNPRIFPIIIVIIVIALIIAAIVSVARMVFFSGSNTDKTSDTGQQAVNLRDEVLNTGDARAVRYTVRGPIVADENFRSYQITISPTNRSWTVYKGYLDEPLETKSYSNNSKAYESFVYALDKANISKTRSAENEDLRGVCANKGFAYQFETMENAHTTEAIWTGSCKGSKGSMAASVNQIQELFTNQIPDFSPVFDKRDNSLTP